MGDLIHWISRSSSTFIKMTTSTRLMSAEETTVFWLRVYLKGDIGGPSKKMSSQLTSYGHNSKSTVFLTDKSHVRCVMPWSKNQQKKITQKRKISKKTKPRNPNRNWSHRCLQDTARHSTTMTRRSFRHFSNLNSTQSNFKTSTTDSNLLIKNCSQLKSLKTLWSTTICSATSTSATRKQCSTTWDSIMVSSAKTYLTTYLWHSTSRRAWTTRNTRTLWSTTRRGTNSSKLVSDRRNRTKKKGGRRRSKRGSHTTFGSSSQEKYRIEATASLSLTKFTNLTK